MTQFVIQIVDVEVTDKTTAAGKPYKAISVAYKGPQGKLESKQIFPFGNAAPAHKALLNAVKGDAFTINSIKNEKGYNDWTDAVPTTNQPVQDAPMLKGVPTSPGAERQNTWNDPRETAAERANKQVYIVRQSSITAALDYLKHQNPKGTFTLDEVKQVAAELTAFVIPIEDVVFNPEVITQSEVV